MRAISLRADIEAPRDRVWTRLADLPGHPRWMSDVLSIEFPTGQTAGLGTQMVVVSRLGPLRARDILLVSAWEEPARLAVEHRGRIKGWGEFRLEEGHGATMVTWNEKLEFPWFLGGALTSVAARPFLVRVFRRNLASLRKEILSDP